MPATTYQAARAERFAQAEERRAAKWAEREARRARNRAEWAESNRNANRIRAEARAAAAPIPAEAAPGPNDSRALQRLRKIMANPDEPLHKRLDCAEIIIPYEIAPSALAGLANEEVAAGSLRFMRAVADADDTPDVLRIRALKSIAAIENARAARPPGPDETAAQKELRVALINAHRRMELARLGRRPPPGARWTLDLSDTFDWPAYSPAYSPAAAPPSIGDILDQARSLPPGQLERQSDQRHQQMIAILAKNRRDGWQDRFDAEPAEAEITA